MPCRVSAFRGGFLAVVVVVGACASEPNVRFVLSLPSDLDASAPGGTTRVVQRARAQSDEMGPASPEQVLGRVGFDRPLETRVGPGYTIVDVVGAFHDQPPCPVPAESQSSCEPDGWAGSAFFDVVGEGHAPVPPDEVDAPVASVPVDGLTQIGIEMEPICTCTD